MKVSVIIPTYNRSYLLRRAIDSVLEQTYEDYEVIVIDDGSTDETKEVISKYINKHEPQKVRYFFQQNQGSATARNTGIKAARGEFIAFLDCDDEFKPDKLIKQVSYMEKYPQYGLTYTDAEVYKNGDFLCSSKLKHDGYKYQDEKNAYLRLLKEMFISTPTVMLRSEVFDDVGLFNHRLIHSQDSEMWLRVAKRFKIGFINEPLSIYHIHEKNISNLEHRHQIYRVNLFSDLYERSTLERKAFPIIKNELAERCFYLGYSFLSGHEIRSARENFYRAHKLEPFKLKYTRYLIISYLPVFLVEMVRRFKLIFRKSGKKKVDI